jgi:uncharacterized DUF497 family protein
MRPGIEYLHNCNYNNGATVYSWDEAKNRRNLRKHSVSFEVAKLVFDDPLHISRQDRAEDGERRWQTLGMVDDIVLLPVVHSCEDTDGHGEHVRIISARRATRLERRVYEQGA